jgi:uncharacterized lipoprotein YddW (UPF0748 family)
MQSGGARVRLRRMAAALAVCCLGLTVVGGGPVASAQAPAEVRALWVLRTSLSSPSAVASLVHTARERGFNTLLVQVRGRGDAYYSSTLEPRATDLIRQPSSFDPLDTVVREAHDAGLRVHAWINLNLVSSAAELPASRDHLIYRHPEWLMVPREIAQDVARLDATSPAYIGKLARWTRAQADKVEGLYASPLQPDAAKYAESIVGDIARRYEVDGIHLDYVRYPNDQFDYSRYAISEFRAEIRPGLAAPVRAALDAKQEVDLFAYPDRFPAEWKSFRRARLSALVMRLRTTVKAARPGAMMTIAAAPDAQEAFDRRLQDWRTWIETGVVDAICPMAYTQEPARFAEQIAAARDIAGGRAVWAGIGAYRLTPSQTIDNIQTTRRLGTGGFILFSYDSLINPAQAPDYLATVSRSAFGGVGAVETGSSR